MTRTGTWATVWTLLRLAMAGVIAAAVVAQLVRSVSKALESGRDIATIVSNFFSFFTILSNLTAVVALASAAIWYLARGRTRSAEPAWIAVLLMCATTYMITTGIVYNLLLRGYPLEPGGIVPWSNEVLHLFGPLFLLADLFLGPKRRALPWRAIWIVVAFPVLWAVYTMIRGPLITNPGTGDPFWYPYPFLNPHNPGLVPPGYAGVVVYVIGIAAAILGVAALVMWWGRRIGSTTAPHSAATIASEDVRAAAS